MGNDDVTSFQGPSKSLTGHSKPYSRRVLGMSFFRKNLTSRSMDEIRFLAGGVEFSGGSSLSTQSLFDGARSHTSMEKKQAR